MDPEEQMKRFLKEIFPKLDDATVEKYILSGCSLDKIVSDIVENQPPPIELSVSECLLNLRKTRTVGTKAPKIPRQFNFPELFGSEFVDTKLDPFQLREESKELYLKAKEYRGKIRKGTADYYIIEADKCVEKASKVRRLASVIILRKMLDENKAGTIDLHNLYVDEAILFLEDYMRVFGPESLVVATGRAGNSPRIRPAVKAFLEKRRMVVKEDGPFLIAKRKKL